MSEDQRAGLKKVKSASEWVVDKLNASAETLTKFVVFAHHRSVLDRLQEVRSTFEAIQITSYTLEHLRSHETLYKARRLPRASSITSTVSPLAAVRVTLNIFVYLCRPCVTVLLYCCTAALLHCCTAVLLCVEGV